MKKSLPGRDATILATLSMFPCSAHDSLEAKELMNELISSDAILIAKAILNQPSTVAANKAAHEFKQWADSLKGR